MDNTEELQLQILELNKKLAEMNIETSQSNKEFAHKEHLNKLELFAIQKDNLLRQNNYSIMDMVLEFQKTFLHHYDVPQPHLEDNALNELRIALLEEEVQEMKDAIKNKSKVDLGDALCDTMYILLGNIISWGYMSKFFDMFNEVHRSNMSKVCMSKEEADATVSKYKKEGVEAYHSFNSLTNKFIVKRKSDDKVLKSINYSTPDLDAII